MTVTSTANGYTVQQSEILQYIIVLYSNPDETKHHAEIFHENGDLLHDGPAYDTATIAMRNTLRTLVTYIM